jgi:hypothetical protein
MPEKHFIGSLNLDDKGFQLNLGPLSYFVPYGVPFSTSIYARFRKPDKLPRNWAVSIYQVIIPKITVRQITTRGRGLAE